MMTRLVIPIVLTVLQVVSGSVLSRDQRFILDADTISCNFESSGLCGYTQDRNDTFNWSFAAEKTGSSLTGPNTDHTLHTRRGHFMYIESSSPRRYHDKARLISPMGRSDSGRYSVGFYYSMYGAGMGTLNVYVDSGNGGHSPAFTMTGNQGTLWHYGCVDIPSNSMFKVIFEGSVGADYHSDMAVDDVKLHAGTCHSIVHTTSSGTTITQATVSHFFGTLPCNFDHGMCGYTQDRADQRDWLRHAGNTTSRDTGPSIDHTVPLRQGFYMYFESSSPTKLGDKARLISPQVTLTSSKHSVRFWYHMYGQEMGTLNVYLKKGSTLGSPRYQVSGNQGDVWKQGCVNISSGYGPFQLVFEAVRGTNFHSDIAIDDVTVTSTSCAMTSSITTTDPSHIHVTIDIKPQTGGTTTQLFTTTPFPVITGSPTSSVTCNFDQELLCGYTSTSLSTSVTYNWQWMRGQSINTLTGPIRDHTTGQGHYMSAVSLGTTSAVAAKSNLYTPALNTTSQPMSIHFWYNTYSSVPREFGALFIYIETNGTLGSPLFSSTTAHHSTNWQQSCIDLPPNKQNVRLVFQAVHGDGVHGDIAVDDVTLTSGKCISAVSTTPSGNVWSGWYSATCSVTCGSGTMEQIRHCSTGHDEDCVGSPFRHVPCSNQQCV